MELTERFWQKVRKTDSCWLWTSALDTHGYGQFKLGGRTKMAHRLVMGDPKGKHVLHRCDNPRCVNPDHLFIGCHADNMRDMAAKGRGKAPRGEATKMAKITEKQAKEVVSRLNNGEKMVVIARMMEISYHIVANIKRGSSWKHLS